MISLLTFDLRCIPKLNNLKFNEKACLYDTSQICIEEEFQRNVILIDPCSVSRTFDLMR